MTRTPAALVGAIFLLTLSADGGPGPAPKPAAPVPVQAPKDAWYQGEPLPDPERILVKYRPQAPEAARAVAVMMVGAVERDYALTQKPGKPGADFYNSLKLIKLNAGTKMADALAFLRADPSVEYAEPDQAVYTHAVPNDPKFNLCWGMHNTGQSGGTADADMDLPEAWDLATGASNIVVAVIDTGVDYAHPDLSANIWANPGEVAWNGIDDDANGYVDDVRGWDFANNDNNPMDDHYHGTHCAGTIAGVGNNGVGVAGVCWSAKIMPLKFLSGAGTGRESDAIRAIQYATMMGARVMSNSWGGAGYSQALQDAILASNDAGVVFVASAGNNGQVGNFPAFPAALAGVIAVGATDARDQKAAFSNWGGYVDIAAPGVDIASTVPGNAYGYLSGTSMAGPHVAGLCALLLSRGASPIQVEKVLVNSADEHPPMDTVSEGWLQGGYWGLLGGGRANASWALRGLADFTAPSAPVLSGVANLGSTCLRIDGTSGTDNLKVAGYRVEKSLDGVNYSQVPGVFKSLPITVTALPSSMPCSFRVRTYDIPGNLSGYSNVVSGTPRAFGVAPTTPRIESIWSGVMLGQSVAEFAARDVIDPDSAKIRYTFDFGDGNVIGWGLRRVDPQGNVFTNYPPYTWVSAGTYQVRVKATDFEGNDSPWSAPFTVTVSPTPPGDQMPSPSMPQGPSSTNAGKATAISASATDPDSNTFDYQCQWGDGFYSAIFGSVPGGTPITLYHVWATPGTYSVRCRTGSYNRDGAGRQISARLVSGFSAPLTVTVGANLPPSAPGTPSGPSSATALQGAAYTVTGSSDPTSTHLRYAFDWGDGTQSTLWTTPGASVTLSHAWASSGTYTVRVQAIDDGNLFSDWSSPFAVSVSGPPKPVSALAHDTSKRGFGVQAGDRVILFFDKATLKPAVTSANINALLPVTGKSWGQIQSAAWHSEPAAPGYMGQPGYDGLVITFAGSGTTVGVGDTIRLTSTVGDPASTIQLKGSFSAWLRGDANGDGMFTPADVVALQGFIYNGTNPPPHLVNADVNSDGQTTPADVVQLLNWVYNEVNPPRQDNF